MKKILYFDRPFKNALGGDKNRSRYLYKVLGQDLSVELCIIEASKADPDEYAALTLKGGGFKSPFLPRSIVIHAHCSPSKGEGIRISAASPGT